MEFQEVVARRRSIREYSNKPVDPSCLDRILRAVSRAPSAGNLQAYRVAIVSSPPERRALARAAGDQPFLAQAPVDLVFFSDPERSAARYGERGASLYSVQDATIAATFALLEATDEGLSSVWVGAFDETEVRSICRMTDVRPVAIVAIGHGAEDPPITPRRDVREIVRRI